MRRKATRETLRHTPKPHSYRFRQRAAAEPPEVREDASRAWFQLAARTKAEMTLNARAGVTFFRKLDRARYREAMRLAGWAMPRSRLLHR